MNDFNEIIVKAVELHREGKLTDAVRLYEDALKLQAQNADCMRLLAVALRQNSRPSEAINHLFDALKIKPSDPSILHESGITLNQLGRNDEALAYLRKAAELKCDDADILFALGNAYRLTRDYKHAADCYKSVIEMRHDRFDAHLNLGNALVELGQFEYALKEFEAAAVLRPDIPEIHAAMGNLFGKMNELSKAKDCYCKALNLKPDFSEVHYNLGNIMREWNHPDEALICYKNAVRFKPSYVSAILNEGETYLVTGELEKAKEEFRNVLKIDKENSCAWDNLLVSMNYDVNCKAIQVFQEHKSWGERFLSGAVDKNQFTNVPDPSRRIKIGYVSPDFCKHPASYFLEPLFRMYDRERFEVFCFDQKIHTDEKTHFFKDAADHWIEIRELDDIKAAERIRGEGIDILIDCAGHLAGNRLGIFAKRPAPVQVSGFGYPCSTGLDTIDYRFGDSITDTQGDRGLYYTEGLYILPHGFCCFAPPSNTPEPGPLPVLSNGYFTFGSLHTLARLNDKVIGLWSEILRKTAQSRLLIFRNILSPDTIHKLKDAFCKNGIDEGRIDFLSEVPSQGHFKIYEKIDLLLDTFPWSGHTTACESMWMGVPVNTLYGDRHAGRMVSSVLNMIGLTEFINRDYDGYVKTACEIAKNMDKLSSLRNNLRNMMIQSKLCDMMSFTKDMEVFYRTIWEKWCAMKNGKS